MSSILAKGNVLHTEGDATDVFAHIYALVLKVNNSEYEGKRLFRVSKKDRNRMIINCCVDPSCTFKISANSKDKGQTAKLSKCCLQHTCTTEGRSDALNKKVARNPPKKFKNLLKSSYLENFVPPAVTSTQNSQAATILLDIKGQAEQGAPVPISVVAIYFVIVGLNNGIIS